MKLRNLLLATALLASGAAASEFTGYKGLTKQLKGEAKKDGNYATTDDVKKALASKDWAVVDVRTMEEWQAARIEGSTRIGRQNPEKALDGVVLDDEGKFIKPNIIVVCNTASRASIEAETFRKMGFKKVMIYDLVSWIDECNPVTNLYSSHKDKHGTKNKFGQFKAEHCSK
ncbi:MAG: rhodanese-like domain-containing protein [Campylobacterales bacterium]|nr:rhodanese-like domain-containing protein [Campylobacterales bacterium]